MKPRSPSEVCIATRFYGFAPISLLPGQSSALVSIGTTGRLTFCLASWGYWDFGIRFRFSSHRWARTRERKRLGHHALMAGSAIVAVVSNALFTFFVSSGHVQRGFAAVFGGLFIIALVVYFVGYFTIAPFAATTR